MKRFWLVPIAALSLAGAASIAQATPASPLLGALAATSQSAGKSEQVNWRRHHYRRHHHHRRHHHRRHHRHHHHH